MDLADFIRASLSPHAFPQEGMGAFVLAWDFVIAYKVNIRKLSALHKENFFRTKTLAPIALADWTGRWYDMAR